MYEIYSRRVKNITGNSSGAIKLELSPDKRIHGVGMQLTWASGVSTAGDTLAEQVAAITEIRVKVGTAVRRRLSGVQLRDFLLLNGTTYDWDAVSTYVAQLYIPFAPDWLIANVADSLAWNPIILGAPVSIEVDVAALNTSYYPTISAYERISDDVGAATGGILTWEVITPVAGGTSFYVEKEIERRGRLISASIYPATGTGTYATTTASMLIGSDDAFAIEALNSTENADLIARAGLTPAASGRTANIYDMIFARGDALAHGIDLAAKTKVRLKLESASAFVGTIPILLERLEAR